MRAGRFPQPIRSADTPLKQVSSGLGTLPGNLRLASGGAAKNTGKSGNGSAVHRIDFEVSSAKTRYITLEVKPQAGRWMMLNEVRVTSGGDTVPVESYRLLTLPQAELGSVKTDIGTQLTNGAVDYGLDNDCVAWNTETSPGIRDLVVDLEKSETIREITLYSVSRVALRQCVQCAQRGVLNLGRRGKLDKAGDCGQKRTHPGRK